MRNIQCFDDRTGRISRWLLWLFFLGYLFVNIFEGVVLNIWSKNAPEDWLVGSYTEFNQATFYVFDSWIRFLFCGGYLLHSGGAILSPFKKLNTWQYAKLILTRFAIQASEQLATIGTIYLTAAMAQVINQLRIPLVGFLGFCMFRIKLSRNQLLFATAIIPLAIQFCVRDMEASTSSSTSWVGYAVCGTSVVLLSLSNVLVENILKGDFNNFPIWNKQFMMATIDIPIMIVLWFASTGFEMHLSGVNVRTWNPFDQAFQDTWWMTFLLAINAAAWGGFRLCILNWGDALWLNLACVGVMGVLWIIECFLLKDDDGQYVSKFWPTKLLCLFAFTIILIGYELASWDQEKTTKQSLSKSFGNFLTRSQEISDEETTIGSAPSSRNDAFEDVTM